VSVLTTPLAVSVSGPSTAVDGTYQLPLAFSNRMPAASGMSELIQVRAGEVDVPYALVSDANLASRWYVTPADCLGRWPASTTFTVVVKPGILDAFAGKLSAGASTTFSTTGAEPVSPDCGVAGDAAAPLGMPPPTRAPPRRAQDAGAADAADAGAAEAGPDAGVADAGADDRRGGRSGGRQRRRRGDGSSDGRPPTPASPTLRHRRRREQDQVSRGERRRPPSSV